MVSPIMIARRDGRRADALLRGHRGRPAARTWGHSPSRPTRSSASPGNTIRSDFIWTRRRAQIGVRRAGRIGLACWLGLHALLVADSQRQAAKRLRAAKRSGSGDRRRAFAICAGSSRCWRVIPSPLRGRGSARAAPSRAPTGASCRSATAEPTSAANWLFSISCDRVRAAAGRGGEPGRKGYRCFAACAIAERRTANAL